MTQPIPTSSPIPAVDDVLKTFDFFTALQLLAGGKRITRLEWADPNIYGILSDSIVKIYNQNKLHDWIISDGDLSANDWIVLD